MAGHARFPFTSSDMLLNQLPNKKVAICPNPDGTKPVSYKNYRGTHPMGSVITTDGKYTTYYLMWYVWEFIGHLWYLSNDFPTFISTIAENENPDGPGKNDFKKYHSAMMNDSTSVYNRHIYAHFQVMWMKCNNDNYMWNTKLNELRENFNTYIQKRMVDYETREENVHPVFGKWKSKLEEIYGDKWGSYLWQCTNFDELGQFISEHNTFFRKNEDAKGMVCRLNLPEEKQNFASWSNEPLVRIDEDNNIVMWAVGVTKDNNTLVYPATPDVWTTGSYSITPSVSTKRHTSIFPNGPASWMDQCKNKHIKVKFVVLEGDMTSTNYENYSLMKDTKNIILAKNKGQVMLKISPPRPKGVEGESLSDFAVRYQKWEKLVTLASEHCRLVR